MATTFVDKATATGGFSSHPPTVTIPATVQEGDILYLFATNDFYGGGIGDPVTPSGWTHLGTAKNSTTEAGAVFRKTAQVGDAGSTVTVNWGFNAYWGLSVRAYRGDAFAEGEWVTDIGSPWVVLPLDIKAGDVVLAFVWSAGYLSNTEFANPYTLEDFYEPSQYYAFGTITTNDAPADATEMTLAAFSGLTGGAIRIWAFIAIASDTGGSPTPSEPQAPEAESRDRVRSNVAVDAGSVLRATRLLAVEADVTEDFLEGSALDQSASRAFVEALDPDVAAFVYFPAGTQNNERLDTYAGETALGRMASTYPGRIMGTVANLSSGTDTSWSLTEALTYLFQQWASEHAWFLCETVPDLRTARDDGDYSDGKGTPYTSVIGIPQSDRNRRTMREVVDEFLSAVPGAVLTVSSSGELRIVPRDGPDADTTPHQTLDGDDAYQVSTGYPDQRTSVNGAIITNRGWSLEEAVSVMQPSWFQLRQAGTPSDKYLTPPTNVLDLTTSTLLGATGAPGVWPVADEDTVLDTSTVLTWTDPDTSELLIAGDIRYYNYPSGPVDETNDTTHSELNFENVTDLPLDGDWHEVFTLRRSFAGGAYSYFVTLEAMFNGSGIEFRVSDSKLSGPFVHGATWWASGQAVFGITLDALGNRWGNSVTKTARFTYSNGNALVGADGGNALADSVAAYGERVDTINISVFDLDVDTLERIAIAHVLRNIEPKTTRTVEQSAWRAFPIKNDDIGRLVQLPGGEQGIVVNRRYSDDFGIDYGGGSLSSSFDAEIVATGDELLGDTTGFLHLDSGELWVMNDGNPSEVN